jgi:hypothetical protein
MKKEFLFPKDFLWGAATAAHQVEGNNINNESWVFIIPFLFSAIDYGVGFIALTVIVLVRLVLNFYTNNFLSLTPAQFQRYPFRIS